MSACFLQLSTRNIHLFIYYFDILQTGEGFDNIYKLKAYMFRVNGSCNARLKGIKLLKPDSVSALITVQNVTVADLL